MFILDFTIKQFSYYSKDIYSRNYNGGTSNDSKGSMESIRPLESSDKILSFLQQNHLIPEVLKKQNRQLHNKSKGMA